MLAAQPSLAWGGLTDPLGVCPANGIGSETIHMGDSQVEAGTNESEEAKTGRAKTGIEGLDDILAGGFIDHRIYLIEGSPGAGKTTLALQFLFEGVKDSEKCLYITLSETAEELRAGAESHGWTLEGIEIVELVAEESDLDGQTQITMFHASEVELAETTKRVLAAVDQIQPARLVFDSLSELRLLAQNALRYRRQILALKQFFVGRKCTVLLLDDKTADVADMQLQSIAHGVVSLTQTTPIYGPARRRVQVLKFRGTDFRAGFHDFTIRRGGIEVFPRLVASEHSESFTRERIQSGVTALDSLLGGGPDRGTSTLLVGPAGSGKSTIAVQYAVAAAERGDHAAIFAFDESIATLLARTESLGIELRRGLDRGEVDIQQIDPTELSPGEFAFIVRKAVEVDGARVLVIDSLNGYLHAMPQEQFLTAQLHELLTYLGHRGVTTLMVIAQHGMTGAAMTAPIDTSYLADSVVLLRYFEYCGQVKKAISVVKKRSGPHEGSIRELWFDEKGIHLSEPLVQFRGILTGVPDEIAKRPNSA